MKTPNSRLSERHLKGALEDPLCEDTLSLQDNAWESAFFGRRIGRIVSDPEAVGSLEREHLRASLEAALSLAREREFELLELHWPATSMSHVPTLEDLGCRLVETRLVFLTLAQKAAFPHHTCPVGELSFACSADKASVLRLTHEAFTDNPAFYSRFKNRDFFSPEETRRYYSAWIDNYLEDSDSLFAILKNESEVLAYVVYRHEEIQQGQEFYKAILGAIRPDLRGGEVLRSLVSFIWDHIPYEEFLLNLTTQLSNIRAINSYLKLQRRMESASLVYYLPL